jgi:hypothetical protein
MWLCSSLRRGHANHWQSACCLLSAHNAFCVHYRHVLWISTQSTGQEENTTGKESGTIAMCDKYLVGFSLLQRLMYVLQVPNAEAEEDQELSFLSFSSSHIPHALSSPHHSPLTRSVCLPLSSYSPASELLKSKHLQSHRRIISLAPKAHAVRGLKGSIAPPV